MVRTTIQIDQSTRDLLRDKGKKSQTYDQILLKMMATLDRCEEQQTDRKQTRMETEKKY